MGSLLAKLWRQLGNKQRKIVVVGLDNAGKTTILYQLVLGETVYTSPTIGSNVEELQWRNIQFVMWDLGGQTSLRSTWQTYYAGADCVMLVIDSSDRQRLDSIKKELDSMMSNELLQNASLLVLANKQDVSGRMSAAEISQRLCLTDIRSNAWHIQSCCALSGEGLTAGMDWLVNRIAAA